MKQFVQYLTNEFLAEAKSSPRMFEDLAAMEHYMAESYNGRAFVEILQNADDANASSLVIFSCGTDFVIANNGRPFSREDLIAICRSGASSKRRGPGIGYRGVGFKSATSISTEIVIYSSNVFFSFSKSRCAREMNKSVDRVPTVRIPFLVDNRNISESLRKAISKYEKKGYTTFFIFKDGNRDKLLAEITDLSSGWLLFLNHIEKVSVDLTYMSRKVEIKRRPVKNDQVLFTDKENSQSWLIVCGENNTAIAFKYYEHIIPCSNDEALFHCYLPTLDALGCPFKANADFSTDPSRKHIIVNDDDTKLSIESIAHLAVNLLSDTSFRDRPYLIDLLATRYGFSEASSLLERQIISLLRTKRWIPLQDGSLITASEHKIVPSWFDSDSRKKVFSTVPSLGMDEVKTEILHSTRNLDDLLIRCGCQVYGTNEYRLILGNIDAVSSLKDSFMGKLWAYMLRSVYYSPSSISTCFLKDNAGRIVAFSDVRKPVALSRDFLSGLRGVLNAEELDRVSELPAFKEIVIRDAGPKKKQAPEKVPEVQKKIEYSKWKTPVQNCMVSEQLKGRLPKDMSKKSLGYDIESTDKSGDMKYYSVKVVEVLGNSFVLSEKEYVCAERLGISYGVYVIENGNPENNMLIENVSCIPFEKRVREWEWVSGQYEVIKEEKPEELLAIDSKFIKEFSLQYLNRIQVAFLKTIFDEDDLMAFEAEYSCKARSIMAQVNSIADFYLGDTLIEPDLTVKKKYLGGVKYLLDQSE